MHLPLPVAKTGQERADGMSRARSAQSASAANEDSADETTRIFDKRRDRGPSYQATQASASQTAPHSDGQANAERLLWWKELKENWNSLWSIELENKGSVARDHLAIGLLPPSLSSPVNSAC